VSAGSAPGAPEAEPKRGWIDAELAAEFPALRLAYTEVEARARRSPPPLQAQLRDHADRLRGSRAVALRHQPIPSAYRIFFRQIGLDPDTTRVPAEQAALDRLVVGGFQSRGLPDDARLLALLETDVAVWAIDAATIDGPLGIRPARAGDRLGRGDAPSRAVPAGRLTVADGEGPIAVLFDEPVEPHPVTRATRRIGLYAIGVEGVPAICIEEALWTCVEALTA
jgi:DNA/RNA-binding domain of Phe-tRNA-synthetase-like protein